MRTIYFDYNATTLLDPGVREAMLPYLDGVFGNPSSVHHVGRRARAALDAARDRVAQLWRCKPSEIVFTSGGTESNNLAILGSARSLRHKGLHLITSAIEHHAVLHCFDYLEKREGFSVTRLPVTGDGFVAPSDLEASFRADTTFVSILAANNETGSLQPVADLGRLCRERGVLFHSDAVQWFGKEPFSDIHQFNADLVSACAHKLHGPKGAGALFIRSPLKPDPILLGGGHEHERRAGTENLAAIVGLAEAFALFVRRPVFDPAWLLPLSSQLLAAIESLGPDGVTFRGSRSSRLANTVAFSVLGTDSTALLAGLDLEGICASSGAACSVGSLNPSHVLVAMGVPDHEANALVRFSLGRDSTPDEVSFVSERLPDIVRRAQRFNNP